MSSDHSRRVFLKIAPGGALFCWTASRTTDALVPSQQNPTVNQGSGTQSNSTRPSPGGSGGVGPGPGPAQHGGDYQPQTLPPPRPKNQDPAPQKPRKNLDADQKSLRDEVRQLVRDSYDLKQAIEQYGPKQTFSAEMVSKTREIERLAHSIATLAKG